MYTYNHNKKFLLFFFFSLSGKNINFDDKKIRKSTFYKDKTINNIEDIDINNILVSKKKHTLQKTHLNTLLDIMIIM